MTRDDEAQMPAVAPLARIAQYAAGESFDALPAEVVHHTKRALLDWFAAGVAGCQEELAMILERSVDENLGRGGAWLLSGRRASMRTAAMVNATAAHILELDDVFRDGLYHPGAPVIAAALAAGQYARVSGQRLLLGVLAGYEVSTRISAAINPVHYKFWHTTGTVGCLGAAVAAAVVLRCDAAQIAHALATATSFASGLKQAFRSTAMTKPLHAGHAADTGVWAAAAAKRGLIGVADILEGSVGFGRAMGGEPDWDAALADLGQRYNMQSITFKDYACCGQTFPAVDAVRWLRNEHDLDPREIDRISVWTNQQAIDMTADYDAADSYAAKFSLPYVVSSALLFGSLRLAAFAPDRLADSATRQLMTRVEMHPDADIESRFPRQRSARVRIRMTDGREFEHFQATRRGDPEWPLSDQELNDKYDELVTPGLGAGRAGVLRCQLWNLETCLDVGELTYGQLADLRPKEVAVHG